MGSAAAPGSVVSSGNGGRRSAEDSARAADAGGRLTLPRATMSDVRNRLIRCLRDPRDTGPWSDDLLASARANRVHLLLADRAAIGPLQGDLRAAMALEAARER